MLRDPAIQRIVRKEIDLFFASPIAYLFLATFLAVTLFIFFWGEAFFVRNIADVRPMFEWLPILLIFLSAALTMRMWSEEHRSGTMEFVITLPVSAWRFVLGKFFACWLLLAIALALTLPLPITISWLADLDWGPVWAAYIAALLLGGAYLSIGLFISARSDNQIVSLMLTTVVCAAFYLLGADVLTNLFGNQGSAVLRALGSGSRFDAITRGVIDFRDLYFYLGITAVFLCLNSYAIEKQRWADDGDRNYHRYWRVGIALLVANILAVNLWLAPVTALRADVTQGQIYSISPATKGYLQQLREPLLIRGYFSAKTHPLLAPLIPQLRDLIREYAVAGQGNVQVEFIDPIDQPELEDEANNKYGIRPVPFQVADRYQAALVSSYFNVLVQYGDQYQVLGFQDLIEVKAGGEADLKVQLRNPEYDITRSIKKVLYDFQSEGNLFASLPADLQLTGYFSADSRLPTQLVEFKTQLVDLVNEMQNQSAGKLQVDYIEPEANGGEIARQLQQEYGLKPMAASLFDTNTFYFYMLLSSGDTIVQIPLVEELTTDSARRGLEAGLKRFAQGFMKTIAVVTPPAPPPNQFGQVARGMQFNNLRQLLSESMMVTAVDLQTGRVPNDADILLLLAPEALERKQLFAVDQFLMQGGTVIMASSPFVSQLGGRQLMVRDYDSGLRDWLTQHGITIESSLILDPQSGVFPIPTTRNVGGFSFQELRMIDYPYFIDVRGDGLNGDNGITADVQQVTMPWASPIKLNIDSQQRQVTELLWSSEQAWTSESTSVTPRIRPDGRSGFEPEADQEPQRYVLAAMVEGPFTSYFNDQDSPLLSDAASESEDTDNNIGVVSSVINKSPESARLIVFASNEFANDQLLQWTSSINGTEYLNPLQLIVNSVEWSLEDRGLLSIRARGHFNRTLPPLTKDRQLFWEYANYILASLGVGLIAFLQRQRRVRLQRRYTALLMSSEAV